MELYKAFNMKLNENELICFVGGGGKTSSMLKLAKELKELGKRVLVTTTTAVYRPSRHDYDRLILTRNGSSENLQNENPKGSITIIGKEINCKNKLLGLEKETIDDIFQQGMFDYVLVEGDGSRNKPIKAPDTHEPVVPNRTTIVIGLIGLDSIYKRINSSYVHRPYIFSKLVNRDISSRVDENMVLKLVISENGLFKSVPKRSKKYLFLNKAESKERINFGNKVKELLENSTNLVDKLIIGSVIDSKYDVTTFT